MDDIQLRKCQALEGYETKKMKELWKTIEGSERLIKAFGAAPKGGRDYPVNYAEAIWIMGIQGWVNIIPITAPNEEINSMLSKVQQEAERYANSPANIHANSPVLAVFVLRPSYVLSWLHTTLLNAVPGHVLYFYLTKRHLDYFKAAGYFPSNKLSYFKNQCKEYYTQRPNNRKRKREQDEEKERPAFTFQSSRFSNQRLNSNEKRKRQDDEEEEASVLNSQRRLSRSVRKQLSFSAEKQPLVVGEKLHAGKPLNEFKSEVEDVDGAEWQDPMNNTAPSLNEGGPLIEKEHLISRSVREQPSSSAENHPLVVGENLHVGRPLNEFKWDDADDVDGAQWQNPLNNTAPSVNVGGPLIEKEQLNGVQLENLSHEPELGGPLIEKEQLSVREQPSSSAENHPLVVGEKLQVGRPLNEFKWDNEDVDGAEWQDLLNKSYFSKETLNEVENPQGPTVEEELMSRQYNEVENPTSPLIKVEDEDEFKQLERLVEVEDEFKQVEQLVEDEDEFKQLERKFNLNKLNEEKSKNTNITHEKIEKLIRESNSYLQKVKENKEGAVEEIEKEEHSCKENMQSIHKKLRM